MAVRSTMAALILRVRDLINDNGSPQVWSDQQIQDAMDESRIDYKNEPLIPKPTFAGSSIQYLDYWHDLGGWEDGMVLKQYLITTVTPATSEPIAGHWTFAATTLPPVFISGSLHDVYRAAADLLERWAAKYAVRFDFSSDSQSFRLSQVPKQLQDLAHIFRLKQRAGVIIANRSDLASPEQNLDNALSAHAIDYMSSGQGS